MVRRRFAACASLLVAAVIGVGPLTWGLTPPVERVHNLIWSLAIAASALLLTHKAAQSQAVARGVAWSVILPTAVVSLVAFRHGFHPSLLMVLPAAAAAVALALARPFLDDDEARATFAPIAMRSWLLASAVAAIGSGLAIARLATALAVYRSSHVLLGFIALALVTSGIGVVRMRAWGVLAGALASALALVGALHFRSDVVLGWPVLATMLPGLMMVGGVVAARAGFGRPQTAPSLRRREAFTTGIASSIRVESSAAEHEDIEDDALVLDRTARARS